MSKKRDQPGFKTKTFGVWFENEWMLTPIGTFVTYRDIGVAAAHANRLNNEEARKGFGDGSRKWIAAGFGKGGLPVFAK